MCITDEGLKMERQMDYQKAEKRQKSVQSLRNALVYTLLTFWAVMVLFPFCWMLLVPTA